MIPAPRLDLAAAAPLLLVSIGAFVVLLGEIFLKSRRTLLGRAVTPAYTGSALMLLGVLFLALTAAVAAQGFAAGGAPAFNLDHPMIRLDRFASFATVVVCMASALSLLLSKNYLDELRIQHGEYYALVLLATAGMVLLVQAVDLITVFLGIEIMSIPIYVLAGFDRRRLRSNESALKYFLVGSFASAILLYGMALLYGATGSTHFDGIQAAFSTDSSLAMIGLALVLVGFTFKISSVPFHQWTPDVYEGAPVSVTAFMSVTVKLAAFAALLRIVEGAFGEAGGSLEAVLYALALLTMIVGNVMAVIQDNVKRLLAYSSVAHAGYLLVGFVAATEAAYAGVLFYLLVYVFMNLGAFGVLVALAHRGQECERVDQLAGLARTRPALAAVMTLFMVSLAGIPGTGGFMAKFAVFSAAVGAGHVTLAIVAVLASLVSVYYYLRIPVLMYMREPGEEAPRMRIASGEALVLTVCAVAVIWLGIFPQVAEDATPLLSWMRALDWTRESVASLAAL
ncbi:MAG: NADH-quinone oxidoreductase subunit N [Myxococcota bacterium]|nr:NADH-quinone oxidoreductase subunit N [Myxococcota bacterium]